MPAAHRRGRRRSAESSPPPKKAAPTSIDRKRRIDGDSLGSRRWEWFVVQGEEQQSRAERRRPAARVRRARRRSSDRRPCRPPAPAATAPCAERTRGSSGDTRRSRARRRRGPSRRFVTASDDFAKGDVAAPHRRQSKAPCRRTSAWARTQRRRLGIHPVRRSCWLQEGGCTNMTVAQKARTETQCPTLIVRKAFFHLLLCRSLHI